MNIYKPGEVFSHYEFGTLKCVLDKNDSCSKCIFSEDGESSCPPKEYNRHPCYHTDRGDEVDVHFIKVFKKLSDVPEFPGCKTAEESRQLADKFIEAGAIPKKDLIPGGWYLGQCRNTNVAQWWPHGGFHYIRYKMDGKYVDTINHFEDDDGYDVFVPFKLLYSDEN